MKQVLVAFSYRRLFNSSDEELIAGAYWGIAAAFNHAGQQITAVQYLRKSWDRQHRSLSVSKMGDFLVPVSVLIQHKPSLENGKK